MNGHHDWIRVTKKSPCPQCKKPDWCEVCPTLNLVLCMRVDSDRPSKGQAGGWLHRLSDEPAKYVPPVRQKPVVIDANAIWRGWRKVTSVKRIDELAEKLGVDPMALDLLGCAWSEEHRAYAFPMYDGNRRVIGLRLRTLAGDQYAVTGSRAGLFIPSLQAQPMMYVTEGASDCAALLQLGLFAIGRPSCMGQEEILNDFIRHNQIRRVVLVVDVDDAGQRGAERLQATLKIPSVCFYPPCKDARAALLAGLDVQTISSCVGNLVWSKP